MGIVLSLVLPRWTAWFTAVAAVFLAVTVLLATSVHTAARLLGGAACIGGGVSLAAVGLPLLQDGQAFGLIVAVSGAAVGIVGVSIVRGSHVFLGAAGALCGLGIAATGIAWSPTVGKLPSAATVALGLAIFVTGLAKLHGIRDLYGAAAIGLATSLSLGGTAALRNGFVLGGVALLVAGIAAIVLAGSKLQQSAAAKLWHWWRAITQDRRHPSSPSPTPLPPARSEAALDTKPPTGRWPEG
ncbi:hypothetical protein OWR29_26490 [Actinoplanes sp. Pm04-4]|uniref:DUF4203 domain-containing protein n=1 Tax=Paractinoplanes pyxinae TaxID=2997416 RepID=A0ABT4B4Y4_9ACTN|nr:hypothetical protein [Actinoplanes pyxinae]MCY1141562.1 hypothetical protein [Actinoplanes pyxinae]